MCFGTKRNRYNSVKEFLKNNRVALFAYFVFVVAAVSVLLVYGKEDVSLYLNQYVGNAFLDRFFYFITYLGDGRTVAFILAFILFYNVRLGLSTTLSFLSSSLVANLLKYTLFDDVNRPYYYYQYFLNPKRIINYVEGVDLHIHNSFPSGHSTQAFAIFMCLVFASKSHVWKLIWLSIALLTSYSRVYLSQHWLTDVTAGSLIGFIFSLVFEYSIIYKNTFQRLNISLSDLIKRERTIPK